MAEIKVSLNIKLPGRVLLSQESADALEKQNLQGYSVHKMVVEWGKGKKDLINIKTRNCVPAVQSINISKEAYEYMTAKDKKKKMGLIVPPSQHLRNGFHFQERRDLRHILERLQHQEEEY